MRPSTEPTAIARTASWVVSSGALGSSGKGFPSFTRDMSPAASSWGALCACALARGCHRSTKASRRVVDWELLLILLLWIRSRVQVDLGIAGSPSATGYVVCRERVQVQAVAQGPVEEIRKGEGRWMDGNMRATGASASFSSLP